VDKDCAHLTAQRHIEASQKPGLMQLEKSATGYPVSSAIVCELSPINYDASFSVSQTHMRTDAPKDGQREVTTIINARHEALQDPVQVIPKRRESCQDCLRSLTHSPRGTP